MPRYPFGARPAPRRRYPQPRAAEIPPPAAQPPGYADIFRHASFSPELSFLLAMTLKDGVSRETAMEMLRKIEPFVSGGDKEAIHSIFNAQRMAAEYRPPVFPPNRSGTGLNSFSRLSRQQALLDVLSQYAGADAKAMMRRLAESARMQDNFERMTRRMEKLKNMNISSPEQMFEALSVFMPPEEQNRLRNLQNMMRMMNNMGGFHPEDMFKFMGGGNAGNAGDSGGMNGMGNMGSMANMANMMSRMMGSMGKK